MRNLYLLLAAGILAAGCTKTDTDTDETGESGVETDDTDVTPPSVESYNWDTDGLTVVTADNTGGFDLGIAETGSTGEGWFGEDCFNGTAGYNICHSFSGSTGTLAALGDGANPGDPDDVVAGTSTLFNKDLAYNGDGSDRLTYMVTFDDGSCVVWGEDPTYYSSFSCSAM